MKTDFPETAGQEKPEPRSKSKLGGFAGDVFKLVSGTTIVQILGILAAPLLTRLYSPETFGLLAIFTSFTSILAVIVCLRYEMAIVLPESDEEAANLLALSLGIAALVSLVSVPVFWLAGPIFAQWLNAPELSRYLWLVPPVLLFGGIGMGHPALNYWATRTRNFKGLSVTRVIGAAATLGTQVGLGYAGFVSAGSLIGASIFGGILSPLALAWQVWRQDGKLFLRSINLHAMLSGFGRYKKFPIFATWSGLLNSASWQLPVFLLGAFFSPTIVGFYSLGFRILQMPMNLIGGAISQVFFQRAAEAKIEGTLANLAESVFRRLVMLGLFPMLMLTIVGRDVFVVVFGVNWAEAGVYTQILSVWAFFWFISSPMSTLFTVLERQEFGFFINIALFITRLLSLGIGGYLSNARLALLTFTVTGILVYGYQSLAIMASSGVAWSRMMKSLLSGITSFLPFGVVVLCLKFFNIHEWIVALVTIILSVLYYLLLVKKQPDILGLTLKKNS